MALDLTGIVNENEFYTHHYLTAILENDLKGFFSQWADREAQTRVKPPYDQLARLHKGYFVLRNKMERLRNSEEILAAQREFIPELLTVLGYEYLPDIKELDSGTLVPIVGEVRKTNGVPDLWIIETISPVTEETDPLESTFIKAQYGSTDAEIIPPDLTLTEIITKQIYTLAEPPRWIILLNMSHVILLDRSKWNERRFLRFDLTEILSRRVSVTLRAMSALLHRESICPEDGISLLDTLDECSHKHAFAVSEDLKYSAREAVELLGNEALYYIRTVRKEGIYDKDMADQLTRECLRYLYRLLFLFYIEARPELGYAPMNSEEYRTGYSLEDLRDIELQPLTEEPSQNGYFIQDSLRMLFRLIFEGFNYEQKTVEMAFAEQRPVFCLFPLSTHLFDPARTSLLNGVKFRNATLQKVIELLSLSRATTGNHRRGRISYAQLGINQLGAVYEGLLSYSGFFAEKDLYEVKKAGTEVNALDTAFFVNAEDFPQYEESERVYNPDGTLKIYPRGTFIYRLAGRNREKTASYYTPEVLTRCLVKYALKELLKDKTADDILKLTVCELAMGSAAFLNEAINQLAEAYLDRKQKETGETIAHDAYGKEKQKVKAFIADSNVFGVDLNPVAVELAEVSLWLNAMYVQDDSAAPIIPWFGNQLVCGNSLIGARRQVFAAELLEENRRGKKTWLDVVPERVPVGTARPDKTVYHFLLPDPGMANYTDKIVREMAKNETDKIKAWRKDFIKPFSAAEIETLVRLSDAVDKLWLRHAEQSRRVRELTRDAYSFFGHDEKDSRKRSLTTKEKDDLFNKELLSENVPNSSPFRRLKLVMDYWCALWFWPIQEADKLPSRDEFLMDLSLILEGAVYEAKPGTGEQLSLIPDKRPVQAEMDYTNEFGFVNVDALCDKDNGIDRLSLVSDIAAKHHFHHWELVFADIFTDHGGFDLNIGNPPWIRLEWNEANVISDVQPIFLIRKHNSSEIINLRKSVLNNEEVLARYISEYEEASGQQSFLTSRSNYELLVGKANLYKCFICVSWIIGNKTSYCGFLHPETVYDDSSGGLFRENLYKRLKYHFQFQNGLNLFPDVAHREKFSINIYGQIQNIDFLTISNLFNVNPIDLSFSHDGHGSCEGIKTKEDQWNLSGHKNRIIRITTEELEVFKKLYEAMSTKSIHARLPVVHSTDMLSVLKKMSLYNYKLLNLKDEYVSTIMFDETASLKHKIIKKNTDFLNNLNDFILSGPHIYNACPIYKTPRRNCKEKSDYDVIDLTYIEDSYYPRTNYTPSINNLKFNNKIQSVPWDNQKKVTDYFRLCTRFMLPQANERTLVSAIIIPKISHVMSCYTVIFKDLTKLVMQAGSWASLPIDFFVKTTGNSNIPGIIDSLPFFHQNNKIILRTLCLNCITSHYKYLWETLWIDEFKNDAWTKNDNRLNMSTFGLLTKEWKKSGIFLMPFERRQALVEIDVLAAMALGLTLDELCTIYRIQFPVLRQNENDTWYDQDGRIVFTVSKGLPGVGFSRPEWNEIKDMKTGTVSRTITDDTLPGGPVERTISYTAPFDRCDREADYATAWAAFEKRGLK